MPAAGAGIAQGEHVVLQHEVPLETVEAALDAARAAGAVSLLNTAPFRTEAAALLAKADYIVANETEFDLYAPELGAWRRRPAGPHARLRREKPAAPSSSRLAAKA